MTINIVNQKHNDTEFSISFEIPSGNTTDSDTGLQYVPAPEISKKWIKIAESKVIIPPFSIAHVPIEMHIQEISENMNIPNRWEFRIRVVDLSPGGIQIAFEQRWLISMKN